MNALDDFWDTFDTLAIGDNQRLHDWWIHSCFACRRNCGGVDKNHSGTKTFLTVGILET